MTSTRTTIERKIKGLLAQAADREGTPEGEAFLERALALMAKYGVERTQLADADDNEVIKTTINVRGSYTYEQAFLASFLARALHCQAVADGDARSSRCVYVVGVRRHIERVEMLFSLLNPKMIAGANAAYANRPGIFGGPSAPVVKRSYMRHFASRIRQRLEEAEATAVKDAGEGAALVVLDDDAKAEQRFREEFPNVRTVRSQGRQDNFAAARGTAAANSADLGQTRIRNRVAISA